MEKNKHDINTNVKNGHHASYGDVLKKSVLIQIGDLLHQKGLISKHECEEYKVLVNKVV